MLPRLVHQPVRLALWAAALAAGVLALAMAAAPAADAERRPTRAERLEIANAVGVPKRCLVTRVSTRDDRWAVAWMRRCGLDGGSALFHFRRGLWRDSYTGPDEPGGRCREIRVVRRDILSRRVARDLGVCGRR